MAKLLFFGKLGDLAGGRERIVDVDDKMTVAALKIRIANTDRDLGEALVAPGVRVIINEVFVLEDTAITDGDEIAFIPLVSGG